MSTAPDALDIAKFKLDTYKTIIDLQIKAMDVYGEFNLRMMEAAEKQIKVATDQFKLQMLQQSYLSFRAAQQEVIRRGFALQQKLERYVSALNRLNYLAMGETIPPMFVGLSWRGFWFLTSQAPVAAVVAMSAIKCDPAARKGSNFFNPQSPSQKLSNAPANIKSALTLMDWARDGQLVIRLGSPASEQLRALFKVLGDAAQDQRTSVESSLKQARDELTKLREMSWKSLDLTATPPKKP